MSPGPSHPPASGRSTRKVETPAAPPKTLQPKAHQLVTASTRVSFEKARLSEVGYLRPYKRNLVDLFVTRETLPRALETATDLFRRFEARGHRVTLATSYRHRPPLRLFQAQKVDYHNPEPWSPNHPTVVYVDSLVFGLTVYETSEYVDAVYQWAQPIRYRRATPEALKRKAQWNTTTKQHIPSGRLAVRAYFTDWRVPSVLPAARVGWDWTPCARMPTL